MICALIPFAASGYSSHADWTPCRGAKSVEGREMEGVSLCFHYGVWERVVSSPSGVPDYRAGGLCPRRKRFWGFLACKNTYDGNKLFGVWDHT